MIPYKRLLNVPDHTALYYAKTRKARVSHPSFPKHHIILIDGELKFRDLEDTMMPSHGYTVFWAFTPQEIAQASREDT